MEMKRSVSIVLGIIVGVAVLGGIVLYLRSRNAPEAELVPIAGSSANGAARTKPANTPGAPNKAGSRDNGYTPVPYDQLPYGAPPRDPSVPIPTTAPANEPVLSPQGLSLPK